MQSYQINQHDDHLPSGQAHILPAIPGPGPTHDRGREDTTVGNSRSLNTPPSVTLHRSTLLEPSLERPADMGHQTPHNFFCVEIFESLGQETQVCGLVISHFLKRLARLRPGRIQVLSVSLVVDILRHRAGQLAQRRSNPDHQDVRLQISLTRADGNSMVLAPIVADGHSFLVVFTRHVLQGGQSGWLADVYDSGLSSAANVDNRCVPGCSLNPDFKDNVKEMIGFLVGALFSSCTPSETHNLRVRFMHCPQQPEDSQECGIAVCMNALRLIADAPEQVSERIFNSTRQDRTCSDFDAVYPILEHGDRRTEKVYWLASRMIIACCCRTAVEAAHENRAALLMGRDKVTAKLIQTLVDQQSLEPAERETLLSLGRLLQKLRFAAIRIEESRVSGLPGETHAHSVFDLEAIIQEISQAHALLISKGGGSPATVRDPVVS